MSTTRDFHEEFGKYRLLLNLARGGMANLDLAMERGMEGAEAVVALKRMLSEDVGSTERRQMFLNEARIAVELRHPNIVVTREAGEIRGRHYIAMEYLPGEDLRAILQRTSAPDSVGRPVSLAAAIIRDCARGLDHAHNLRGADGRVLGLVHRDVSPSNVIVTYRGEVKLVDFGIVKASSNPDRTRAGVFKGKLCYSAPEQVWGTVDRRSDVFCLGLCLWEMLTGQRLFHGTRDEELLEQVKSAPILSPSVCRPDVPEALDRIAVKALDRRPDNRFQSAGEFAEALDDFLQRSHGPSTRMDIGAWARSLFGHERADLKSNIAAGHHLDQWVPQLQAMMLKEPDQPPVRNMKRSISSQSAMGMRARTAWSDDLAGGAAVSSRAEFLGGLLTPETGTPLISPPLPSDYPSSLAPQRLQLQPSQPQPFLPPVSTETRDLQADERPFDAGLEAAPRARWTLVVAGVIATLTLVTLGWMAIPADAPKSAPIATTIEVALNSDPPGANVFVNGEPTGVVTPGKLTVSAGRKVELRIEKTGYAPHLAQLQAEAPQQLSVQLQVASGRVRFTGIDPKARVFVDGSEIEASAPLELALGVHRLRAETAEDLLFDRSFEVLGGEQVVDLSKEGP